MPDKGGTARRRTTRGILTFTTKVMSKVAPGGRGHKFYEGEFIAFATLTTQLYRGENCEEAIWIA